MDEKEMAKMILEIISKSGNNLKSALSALFLVHNELKNQFQTAVEKAEAEFKFRTDQQQEFRKFTEELSKLK